MVTPYRWSEHGARDALGVKGSQVQILSSRQEGDRPDLELPQVSGPFHCCGMIFGVIKLALAWGPPGDQGGTVSLSRPHGVLGGQAVAGLVEQGLGAERDSQVLGPSAQLGERLRQPRFVRAEAMPPPRTPAYR